MNLPPLTFTEAANLYRTLSDDGASIVALYLLTTAPAEELVEHLASALIVFGKQLERDQEVILEQKDSIEELNAHLRAYLDDHLAGRLESDLSDEALAWPEEDMAQPGAIQSVEWRGPPGDYFDHYSEINHELAKGISEMARERLEEDGNKNAE